MKLYNAGSFFDPRAVPVDDYDGIAAHLAGLARVIVESHPALVGSRVELFREALDRHRSADGTTDLEVAMGLETVHPLRARLPEQTIHGRRFQGGRSRTAATGVRRCGSSCSSPLRSFQRGEQDDWLIRSIETAFSCGASVVSLIPSRAGNGAMESLAAAGEFREPSSTTSSAASQSASPPDRSRGRVFADLWDLKRFATCSACFDARRARLDAMNLEQVVSAAVSACAACGHARLMTLAPADPQSTPTSLSLDPASQDRSRRSPC